MNFRKSVKGGGGSFSIQKFILQIFANIDDTLVMNFGKNSNQRSFGIFPKIHPFWRCEASLSWEGRVVCRISKLYQLPLVLRICAKIDVLNMISFKGKKHEKNTKYNFSLTRLNEVFGIAHCQ